MNSITQEDKNIFFEGLHLIQEGYNEIFVSKSFKDAEDYKFEMMKKYIDQNKEKLLRLREKVHGSK